MKHVKDRRTIGLLINNFDNEYQRTILAGVQQVCRARDVNLLCFSGGLLMSSDWAEQHRSNHFQSLSSPNLDGLLTVSSVISGRIDVTDLVDFVRSLLGSKPLVNMGDTIEGVSCFTDEGAHAVKDLVDHLVSVHGRRRFVFMGGWEGNADNSERRQAFLNALAGHGLSPEPGGLLTGAFVYDGARNTLGHWLDAGGTCDAIVAANDMMAFGCYDELKSRGLTVPDEVSLVGFDDFPSAAVFDVPLTTVSQATHELAVQATSELLNQIETAAPERSVVLASRPVYRASCGCLSQEASFVTQSDQVPWEPQSAEVTALQTVMTDLFEQVIAQRQSPESFLQTLATTLRAGNDGERLGGRWDRWISSLMHRTDSSRWPPRLASLLHQARIVVREASEGRQAAFKLRQMFQARQAQVASSSVSNSFSWKDFERNLAERLPDLGLTGCLVVLFDSPGAVQVSRLIFQMENSRPVALPEGGIVFQADAVIPPTVASRGDRFCYIVESLSNGDEFFGQVLFEFAAGAEVLSDAVGFQIRSALRAVLLVEKLEQANLLIRQNQEQLILSEKMAVLGGLVAGLAHEINTPLGVSITAVSFLEDRLNDLQKRATHSSVTERALAEYTKSFLEACRLSLTNLNRVSDLISNFKQVSIDLRQEEVRVFDLALYLGEILHSLGSELRKGEHRVSVHCEKGLVIRGYPGLYLQLITHLIVNSVAHGFLGLQHGVVTIAARRTNNNHLVFEYADNGRGLEPEDLNHLFEPFYSSLRKRTGNGLGTFVVYNLVTQNLKGTIVATSQPGQGLSYRIEIPLEGSAN